MNRLDALKYFVAAAENLSFKSTALRFSVSPQVISRVISELENELGEPLFKRNTRAIHLTDFGEKFRPYQPITPKRVLVVFGLLEGILMGCDKS